MFKFNDKQEYLWKYSDQVDLISNNVKVVYSPFFKHSANAVSSCIHRMTRDSHCNLRDGIKYWRSKGRREYTLFRNVTVDTWKLRFYHLLLLLPLPLPTNTNEHFSISFKIREECKCPNLRMRIFFRRKRDTYMEENERE